MPAEFKLDRAKRVVRSRAWDPFTNDDLLSHVERMQQLFADGTLDATWAQVADFSEVTSFNGVSSEGLRRIGMLNPWPKVALRVMVTPTDTGFGLGRMYQLLSGDKGDNVRIVRSEAEAVTLLTQRKSR